jgi:hypothetical protein
MGGFSYRAKREIHFAFEIWQASFVNHRIRDAEDYKRHHTYIGDNPVRAGLSEKPELFAWSSASRVMEMDAPPPGLHRLRKNSCFYRRSAELQVPRLRSDDKWGAVFPFGIGLRGWREPRPAVLSIPLTDPQWKGRPPTCHPSGVEGPAVQRTSDRKHEFFRSL